MLRLGRRLLATLVVVALAALGPALWTRGPAVGKVFDVASAPRRPVALVLGASVLPNGQPSPYLQARLQLALELQQAGKVTAILVSGDNGTKGYDEPTAMRDWLIAHGVPANRVVADFAGFDTYSSCVRARKVFGATSVTVVTQTYHLYRALAACRNVGLDAIGVGDSQPGPSSQDWRYGMLREVPADWKLLLDLVRNRQPVLGARETSLDEALR